MRGMLVEILMAAVRAALKTCVGETKILGMGLLSVSNCAKMLFNVTIRFLV